MLSRKLSSTKTTTNEGLKCAIDHILDAQQKGEINEDNVLYIVENINVAGKWGPHFPSLLIFATVNTVPCILLLCPIFSRGYYGKC